jgi:cell division protein FtsI/penicillin-binding protein 2
MLRQAIRPETAQTMARMMVYSVESSSNPDLVPGFRVAGKTGTAEIPTAEGYTSEETITSFAAFLPAADPQIAVLVKLVKPQRSTWAEHVAVPVFAQVAQDAIQILRIQPDYRMP